MTDDDQRAKRAARQKKRYGNKPPRVVATPGKAKALGHSGPPPRTVHVSELSRIKMVTGNEHKYRVVIDGDAMLEWVGFGWIMIRPASEADRRKYPRVVRGHCV